MKNKAILILTLLFCVNIIYAQTSVKKNITNVGSKTITMDFNRADVKIITWDKNEIDIKGSVSINQGDHDENFILDVKETSSSISIKTKIKDIDKLPKITVIQKDGEKHYFKDNAEGKKALKEFKRSNSGSYNSWSNGVFTEISLEIYVPKSSKLSSESLYGDIMLENISAQVDIKNTYGHVDIVFADTPLNQPIKLHSTYDFVDVSLPASAKLDLNLNSGYGEILTDMSIKQVNPSKSRKNFGSKVNGSLNGGGTRLEVEATYNNIYLRKK